MCTDNKTLQQLQIIEEYLHEEHPHLHVERGQGRHQLIIQEPTLTDNPNTYLNYKGLPKTLQKQFQCTHIKEKPGKIILTI